MKKHIILFFFLAPFMSCQKECITDYQLKNAMGERFRTPIGVDQLPILSRDSTFSFSSDKYYLLHLFDANCPKCVNNLETAKVYIEKYAELHNLEFIFIAEAYVTHYAQDAITSVQLEAPIFYSNSNTPFLKNHNLPEMDDLYRTMLLNGDGELLLVGQFFNNETAEELFIEIVQQGCDL